MILPLTGEKVLEELLDNKPIIFGMLKRFKPVFVIHIGLEQIALNVNAHVVITV